MPLPLLKNIQTYRGDTDGFEGILKTRNGDPRNIFGVNITMGFKRNPTDKQLFKLVKAYVPAPEKGFFFIRYPAGFPAGEYYYDLQLRDNNSVETLIRGTFTVVGDITP